MEFIENYSNIIFSGLIIFSFLITLIVIALSIKVSKAKKKWHSFTDGVNVKNIEELLSSHTTRISLLEEENQSLKAELKNIDMNLSFAVQNVGIVKYNAFDNVGNHLSFSLAMLDRYKNGVVITSIYGRDFTTLYGKPVRLGKSDYPLSQEEEEAIDRALKGIDKAKIK